VPLQWRRMGRGLRGRQRSSVVAVLALVGAGGLVSLVSAAGNDEHAATATAVATRVQPPARTFNVLFAGDIVTEDRVMRMGAAAAGAGERYDFAPMFAPVSAIVGAADLAVCHMEVPVGWPDQRPGYWGRSPYGGNLLLSPYEMADSLRRTGFDRCSTASNHSNDLGNGGIDSTLSALDTAGITHVGTARTPAEADIHLLTVNGVQVAHLAYTRYSNTVRPSDDWRMAFAATPTQVADDVRAARAAGAEVVIVSLHLSQEMQMGPTPDDRAFVTQLTGMADIDMVVHHGPHVVQPVEVVNGTTVWWSIGNFVSSMGTGGRGRYSDPRSRDGLLATARFTEMSDGSFRLEPWTVLICNEASERTVRAPVTELHNPSLPAWLRGEMQACVDRTTPVVAEVH
jgi:poly-gamma-glutamate capsule biosynthesis protein CapA/YwtB (metallophosphatase superfamily)